MTASNVSQVAVNCHRQLVQGVMAECKDVRIKVKAPDVRIEFSKAYSYPSR